MLLEKARSMAVTPSLGYAPVLPKNIRLGCKDLQRINALKYYGHS